MDAISKISGFSRSKNIEDYVSLQDLTMDKETLIQENFILSQTAEVLERYLRKRSPASLLGVEKIIEMIPTSTRSSLTTGKSVSISSTIGGSPVTITRSSTISSARAATIRSVAHSSFGVHRINPTVRVDMVERELDEGRMMMERLQRKFESTKFLLQTEEENLRTDIALLDESRTAFESLIAQNTDSKSGKVYYDKFVRFLEYELQMDDRVLRKMKLKTKSLHNEYERMLAQQQQKLELRERLHAIDIEKLLIENKEQLEILEQKSKLFQDLKKAVGRKGQSFVSTKSRLNDTIHSFKNLKHDIKNKEKKCKYIEEKYLENENMLVTTELFNAGVKRLIATFKSPDVHSYLKIQVKLQELKTEKETWERRCKYQRQQITLLEHQLKQACPVIHRQSRSRSKIRSVVFQSVKRSNSLLTSRSARCESMK